MNDNSEPKVSVDDEEEATSPQRKQPPEGLVVDINTKGKTEPKAKVLGEEEKRLKRKQTLEASVFLGLGYGKKKKHHIEAFWASAWPLLEGAGWKSVKGEGGSEGAIYFLPPGVTMGDNCNNGEEQEDGRKTLMSSHDSSAVSVSEEGSWDCASCGRTNTSSKSRCTGIVGEGEAGRQIKCMAWRGGKRVKRAHFTRVRDVLARIFIEKKSEAEAKAAAAFLALVPNAHDIFSEKKDKASESPSSPSRPRQNLSNTAISISDQYAWKDERTHFEKSSSRVGPEYQVDTLPVASYTSANNTDVHNGGDLYERVWDPESAEKSGKLDFIHTRVEANKREAAYDIFYSRGYRLPGFYHQVKEICPSDASDWTKEDKDRFRAAVFEHHENMKEVSRAISKPIDQCITYYLVKFKRTKSYKSLKRSMRRKANVTEGSGGILVCNACGKGGMLIACDTCEAHYHLGCASPPLVGIPDGSWACGNCKRETRSMLSSQDDMSCGMDQQPAEVPEDAPIKGVEEDSKNGVEDSEGSSMDKKLVSEGASTEEEAGDDRNDSKLGLEHVEAKIPWNVQNSESAAGDGPVDNHEGNLDSDSKKPQASVGNKKRKYDSETMSTQGEKESNSSSSQKRVRMDEAKLA